jgi:SAM-dependent methyltransferase
MLLNPQPSDRELRSIYGAHYFLGDANPDGEARVAQMRQATARHYLAEITAYRGATGGRLLDVGCGQGDLLLEAMRDGYEVTGLDLSSTAIRKARTRLGRDAHLVCGAVEALSGNGRGFDVCVLSDVIEHVRDPASFLERIRGLLSPQGVVLLATPSLASWSAKLLRQRWMEFKPEHLYYFDRSTIQGLLFRTGFHEVIVRSGRKVLNLGFVAHHFERFPVVGLTPMVRLASRVLPRVLRDRNVSLVASGMVVLARPGEKRSSPLVSVIVPAYDEAATVGPLLDKLLAKRLAGADMEIIVVESNSGDGTRERVLSYKGRSRVRVVLEDRARGKGHAVRVGLQRARGDFVVIQDADLEYDVEDYEPLLDPLLRCREAFVLGSRHGGSAWKMRHFADQWWLSTALNAGHFFFTTLVNVLFGLRLRDPFTMYKVFRRDCLFGLRFECNRFDFDFELLAKLVRKGYHPVEIPVNYRSRSFRDGKKVSVWRDPLLWMRALAMLRLTRIDPLAEVQRARHARA